MANKGARKHKQGLLKRQRTLPVMLEPNPADCMGYGLFGKETDLPNFVTGSVNVRCIQSMVRSGRKGKKWLTH